MLRVLLLLLATSLAASAQRTPLKTVDLNGHTVYYEVVGEWAITEHDIILGPAAEIEALAKNPKAPLPRAAATFIDGVGTPQSWPGGVIPYIINPNLPDPQRVLDAITHWNTRTPLRLVPRSGQQNYVEFRLSAGRCAAIIGMVGGQQYVELSASSTACPASTVIHEIGHSFGLIHEQSRLDRNQWVTVLYENIDSFSFSQFRQTQTARDRGYYDYDSIMHYHWYAFSPDGLTSLDTVPPGIPFGDVKVLSAADIDGISRAYGFIPTTTTVTTIPAGLTITVDGEQYTAPHAFSWAPGVTHTIAVAETQDSGVGLLPVRNKFVRWTDGGAASRTFTASADQTVVAAQYQLWFPVSVLAVGPGQATLEPASPDGYYRAGATVILRGIPNAGAKFYFWGGSDTEFYGFGDGTDVLRIPVREPLAFRASFTTQAVVNIESSRPGRTIRVDNVPYLTPTRFIWTPGSTHTLALDNPQFDYTSSTKFTFEGWDDGSLAASRTIQAVPGTTFTANFRVEYFLNWNRSGPGTVLLEPSATYFAEGSQVTLTGAPFQNQTLQYWLGDTVGGGLSKTLQMNGPRSALAVFGPRLDVRPANAASYSSNPVFEEAGNNVAPLEIIAIFGDHVGPPGLESGFIGNDGRLSTTVANTRILFDGIPAPIVYTSQTVSTVIVPAEVAGRVFTAITVERAGAVVSIGTATVVDTLPGIFTANSSGLGNVAAFNQDGTLNSPENPAAPGSVVVLYATGAGLMDRTFPNGAVTGLDLARPQAPVSVRIATDTAKVEYAGSVPSLVHGALQLNIRLPKELTAGQHPITLVVGNNRSAPGATIAVK